MSEDDTRDVYVDVPTDLQVALAANPSAMSAWGGLSPHQRKAHIADLESAPEPMARARCLSTLISDLGVRVPGASRR